MKELNNPFVVYGYKGAAYFCDREAEMEDISCMTVSLACGSESV